ncbi:protein serine/threonine kinase [Aureococcus anophagefferens]|uniref:Protein serine/threonine kinase n=1 Tax=Aureococcus anophagefferens TaxID=44056 RepID=A0ABR1FJ18_AURAN
MDSDDDFGGPNSDDGENFEDEGFGGFDDEDQPAATQHYDLPDDVADEFNDEAEDGAVLVMNGEADEGPAVEEWDWKSRLAPLEEDAPAAAAAEEDEDDGAWRDEDDYGNPTEEKKVSLKREARELQCTVDRRLEKKHGGAPVEDAALLDRPPVDGESAAVTLLDGSRYFARVEGPDPGPRANPFAGGGLLPTSVAALKAELAADADAAAAGGAAGARTATPPWPTRGASTASSGNGEGYKKRPTNCVTVAMGRGGGRGSPGGRGGGFKGGKGTGKGAPRPCRPSRSPRRRSGGRPRSSGGDNGDGAAARRAQRRGGGPKGPPPLTRPVICVCNDAFAPHMRPLREVALVFQFRKVPHNLRLASRLKAVAAGERVDVSPAAISALADASLGDVRAAIHALQFAARGQPRRDRQAARRPPSRAVNRGFKDKGADDFELWARCFKRGSTKRKLVGLDAKGRAPHRRGHFELAPYAGAAAGLAAFSRMRVDQRVGQRAAAQRRLGPVVCATDVAAPLRRLVLGARVRAINPDLLRAHERDALERTVAVLAANGLTFERHRGPVDGAVPLVAQWHLRPDVSAASRFGGVEEEPVAPFLKQLLAKQVMLHKVRQRESLLGRDAHPAPAPGPAVPPAKARLGKGADDTKLLLAAAAKAHAPADKPAFSFAAWGTKRARPPSALAANKRANTDAAAAKATPDKAKDAKPVVCTFKFQKGFTNAVRRPVTLADLAAYDALKVAHSELLWSEGVLRAEGFLEALEGAAPIEEREDRVGPIALGAVLGRGAFSSVLEGTWPDGRRCAVKRISKRCTKSRQEVRNVAAEHRALARLSGGPRCLELQGVLATERYVYFAVEHFGEELYGFMKRSGGERVPRGLGDGVVHGVAAGLAFMHALDLAHRDVKPENVLVDVRGEAFRDVRVKVCDLGLSAPLRRRKDLGLSAPLRRRKDAGEAAASPDCVTRALECEQPPSPYEPMFQCCGSMGFFAPDMLDPAGYDGARADVWSLGCLGLEVAAGSGAFARFWFPLYKAFFARGADDAIVSRFKRIMSRTAKAAE